MMKSAEKYDQFKKKILDWANIVLEGEGWNLCFAVEYVELPLKQDSTQLEEHLRIGYSKLIHADPLIADEWKMYSYGSVLFPVQLEDIKAQLQTEDAKVSFIFEKYKQELSERLKSIITTSPHYQQVLGWKLKHNDAYIDEVVIQSFYSIISAKVSGLKSSKEIYFLGENGDGKTLLLSAIHLAFASKNILEPSKAGEFGPALSLLLGSKPKSIRGKDSNGTRYLADASTYYSLSNLYAYGPNRGVYEPSNYDETGFLSIYTNDVKLYDPTMLMQLAVTGEIANQGTTEGNGQRISPKFGKIRSKEIILLFQDLLENNVEIVGAPEDLRDWFRFKEKGSRDIKFKHLSEGYKNILIWVGDLIMRLQNNNPDVTNIADFKGVVIVDEIELHLHPQWQLTLVDKLRTYFPQIQFIFSTHSPTILQGAREDAVIYRVYRNKESGITSVSEPYFKKDMTHMMYNTLVTSPLFGLESARISPETEEPDTSDSFLSSRVAEAVREQLKAQKAAGKTFISRELIDELIKEALQKETKR